MVLTSALTTVEQAGAREQLDLLCRYIDHRPTVLIGAGSHFGTVRAGCDVPVVLVFGSIDAKHMAKIYDTWGGDVAVITRSTDKVDWVMTPEHPTFYSQMKFAPGALGSLPREVATANYNWYVGSANEDGTVEFVPGPGELGNPFKNGKKN